MARKPTALPEGTRIGSLRIQSVLGYGASAVVYGAVDPDGRDFALKVREPGEPALDRRFLREFESLRRLRLPGVVRVFEAGIDRRHIWYSMEKVDGSPLRRWLLSIEALQERVRWTCQIGAELARTLASIHEAGFVHRDLKPSNVLVTPEGKVQILDFGVVQWWAVGESLTGTGGLVGTPSFMAPEQVAGLSLTGAADVYAAGLMLYEGIVGKRPRPPTPHGWLITQCLDRPPPLVCCEPKVPRSLSSVVERCLALDPADRPEAGELAELLAGCADGSTPADWPTPHLFAGREAEIGALDAALNGEGPRFWVLRGQAGSGRRRLVERVRRRALLRGIRGERGRCRVDAPGAPIGELLRRLFAHPERDEWRRSLALDNARTLLQMWPELPLHGLTERHDVSAVSRSQVIDAAADCLIGAAAQGGLVMVLENLEELDAFSARVLEKLVTAAEPRLLVIGVLDPRWTGAGADRALEALDEVRVIDVGPLDAAAARVVANCLVPEGTGVSIDEAQAPLSAVQAGLGKLASIRNEPFHALTARAAELAILDGPCPRNVLEAYLPEPRDLFEMGCLVQRPDGVHIAGESFRTAALAELKNKAQAHDRLAIAWENQAHGAHRWLHVAHHRARGRGHSDQWTAAVQASLAAERFGQWQSARSWLLLLDSLQHDRKSATYRRLRYRLAWCRARVALVTDTERPRQDLVDAARQRAEAEADHARQALLDVDMLLRQGMPQAALDHATSHARRHLDACPHEATSLLLAAGRAQLDLGHPDAALEKALEAEDVLGSHTSVEPVLPVEITALTSEAQVASGALAAGQDSCRRGVHEARRLGLPCLEARLRQAMGTALLHLGRREESEREHLKAGKLFVENGDRAGAASASLHLAALAADRGEAAAARRRLDEGLSSARKLQLQRLLPAASAIQLELARLDEDDKQAQQTLEEYSTLRLTHPDYDLAAIRRARTNGRLRDIERLVLETPYAAGYRAATAQLELARARMQAGQRDRAIQALKLGHSLAKREGLLELQAYARLMAGVLAPKGSRGWGELVSSSLRARWAELFLGVLEFDGRRRESLGDDKGAFDRYRSLHTRAVDLGHRPYVRTAQECMHRLKKAQS